MKVEVEDLDVQALTQLIPPAVWMEGKPREKVTPMYMTFKHTVTSSSGKKEPSPHPGIQPDSKCFTGRWVVAVVAQKCKCT